MKSRLFILAVALLLLAVSACPQTVNPPVTWEAKK